MSSVSSSSSSAPYYIDSIGGQPLATPPVTSLDPPVDPRIDSYGVADNLSELEASFCQATKDFSETEVIQYIKDGHLPPPQQAFKIRKKYNKNIATSLIVLASGTIFRTGKNKEIKDGEWIHDADRSIPGGSESILLGEGCNKRVFSVEDLNTHKRVAIAVARRNDLDILSEMQNEANVTNKILSSYILRVDYYVRLIKPKPGIPDEFRKGYLESEVCVGGSLKQHRDLANNPIVREQLRLAVRDTHDAGFAHHDIDAGNVVFVQSPDVQNSRTLMIKLIDFSQAQKLHPWNKEELVMRDANQWGRLCPWD